MELLVVDHVAHVVVDDEDLEDAHAAAVAGLPALIAADRFHDLRFAELARLRCESARISVSLSSAGSLQCGQSAARGVEP